MKKQKRSAIAALLLIAALLTACGKNASETADNTVTPDSRITVTDAPEPTRSIVNDDGTVTLPESAYTMRDMTTQEVVKDMGLGINLGNTLEATGISASTVKAYETCWGSPEITFQMIEGYKNCGFGVVRIPVAWSNLIDKETYEINADLMNRVNEIVDYVIACDMYAIVNIHWDGGWFENFPTDYDECMRKYTTIWTQIAEHFKDYGDLLMFESLNEEGCWDSVWNRWSGDDSRRQEAYDILNDMNQNFVDIVRGSGGNNVSRHLLIAGYATDIELTCSDCFRMPEDPAGRCAVSVHYYTPPAFCVISEDADWAKAETEWGDESDLAEMNRLLDKVYKKFTQNGIPVIVGEYGCTQDNKEPEQVRNFITTVCGAIYSRDMCPVLWDTTGSFYSRYQFTFLDKVLLEQLTAIPQE